MVSGEEVAARGRRGRARSSPVLPGPPPKWTPRGRGGRSISKHVRSEGGSGRDMHRTGTESVDSAPRRCRTPSMTRAGRARAWPRGVRRGDTPRLAGFRARPDEILRIAFDRRPDPVRAVPGRHGRIGRADPRPSSGPSRRRAADRSPDRRNVSAGRGRVERPRAPWTRARRHRTPRQGRFCAVGNLPAPAAFRMRHG